MAIDKLPRLSVDWLSRTELVRRYWDNICTALEKLYVTTPVTFNTLPTPSVGQTVMVSDIVTLTFGSTYTGGGALTGPVFWNGTDWIIG